MPTFDLSKTWRNVISMMITIYLSNCVLNCVFIETFLRTIFYTTMNIFLRSIPKVNSNPVQGNKINEIEP